MTSPNRRPFGLLLFSLLLALLLAGCQSIPEHTQSLNTTWSRGMLVGTAHLQEPAAMAVTADGETIHLVWGTRQEGRIDLHLAQIDRQRGVTRTVDLGTGLFLPRRYRLFLLPDGELRLLTLARPDKAGTPGVFYMRLWADGALLGPAQRITPPEMAVASYDAVMRPEGVIELAWERASEADRTIHARQLRALEAPAPQMDAPRLLAAQAQGPSLYLEPSGALHLLWYQDRELEGDRLIFYAPVDAATDGPLAGVRIKRHGRASGVRFSSPLLAGDEGHLYAFWHLERLAGLSAGTATVTVVAFPKGAPQQAREFDLVIPEALPEREDWTGQGFLIRLTPEDVGVRRSGYVLDPRPLAMEEGPTLFLVMTAELSYRMKSRMQPVLAALADGTQVGYAPIARTRFISSRPVGAGDGGGNLFASWYDFRGGGKYLVYLATTSVAWRRGAMQLTRQTLMNDLAEELGFGLLAASAFTPMLLFIVGLPLALLGLLALTGRDRKLNERRGRWQLLAALGVYNIVKFLAFASVLTQPTLLRPLPQAWAMPLMVLIPLGIFLVAAGVMLLYIRRADNPGPITSFLLFALIDLPLTAIIYAPAFY
jgi:hypothetical protein